jgi:hypothetical protein
MGIANAGAVAHQSLGYDELSSCGDRRYRSASGECNDLLSVTVKERISGNYEGANPLLHERCEGGLQVAL